MQVLYSMSRDKKLSLKDAVSRYQKGVRHSFELYLFNLLQLIKVTEYARKDAANKLAKLLPSQTDKAFTPKLCDNELMQSLLENVKLNGLFQKYKLDEKVNEDSIRSLYSDFAKTEGYQNYLKQSNCRAHIHKQILLDLYKSCIANEYFNDLMEDEYLEWVDDKSLVVGAIKKTIKALPSRGDFFEEYRPSIEATEDFGEVLLQKVHNEDAELLKMIEPTLKNWDVDRVAVIDMISLKMALCELINFPTIPTKVTLNEFVEISKLYSTDKSKDFINGILDRLMKQLNQEGKIKKEGRGLIE